MPTSNWQSDRKALEVTGQEVSEQNPLPIEEIGSSRIKGALATVTAAGTRVQLPDYPCMEVTVIALRTNTGYIYAGGNDVSSSIFGVELAATGSYLFRVNNTNLIYIDASISGEGVSYVAV